MLTRRYLITGRVQGVGYRAATRQIARTLGLHGHAKNLPDGRVEVLARGEESALAELERFLWRGPPHARISALSVHADEQKPAAGFVIL